MEASTDLAASKRDTSVCAARRLNVTMFVYNPFLHDSRVLRQARTLARSGHHVRVIATCEGDESEQDLDGFHVVRVDRQVSLALAVWRCLESLRRTLAESLPPQSASGLEDPAASVAATGQPADPSERTILPLGIGQHLMRVALPAYGSLWWLKYCRRALRAAARESVDLWVAHDLDTLPIATLARARHGGKLLYDSHELYVEVPTAARGRMWRLRWTLIEGILIRHVDRVMTVSDGVAREAAAATGYKPRRSSATFRRSSTLRVHDRETYEQNSTSRTTRAWCSILGESIPIAASSTLCRWPSRCQTWLLPWLATARVTSLRTFGT